MSTPLASESHFGNPLKVEAEFQLRLSSPNASRSGRTLSHLFLGLQVVIRGVRGGTSRAGETPVVFGDEAKDTTVER
jgi:hypothetical protein